MNKNTTYLIFILLMPRWQIGYAPGCRPGQWGSIPYLGFMLFIFDFDSTLVELQGVDWKKVKKEVIEYGISGGFDIDAETHLVNLSNALSDTKKRKEVIDAIFRKHESEVVNKQTFKVYPSTIPTLQTLRNMGHKTAIASNNTKETVKDVLNKIKLLLQE